MVKLIYIDGKTNYFHDPDGKIVDKYDPDKNLSVHITLDDSILDVDPHYIKTLYGGSVIVQYGNDRYILDDGYQNALIKSGYIVYKDYDVQNQMDNNEGKRIQDKILEDIDIALKKIASNYENITIEHISDTETEVFIENDKCKLTINIDIVPGIVIKNKRRKDNSLPFYMFDKKMDMYGTVYMSIFKCNKVKDGIISGDITVELMQALGGDYHFDSVVVKKGVLYQRGL